MRKIDSRIVNERNENKNQIRANRVASELYIDFEWKRIWEDVRTGAYGLPQARIQYQTKYYIYSTDITDIGMKFVFTKIAFCIK